MHRPHRTGPGHGFTLIEMIVVISIIVSLMAIGIPALINSQNQADDFATQNVIESVHNTCQRNARQLGSAGVVYGFTLAYTSSIPGASSADSITPWVTDGANTSYNGSSKVLQSDFGKIPLWSGNDMKFWDRYRPAGTFLIDGTSQDTGTYKYLYVGYEARTGFPHALASTAFTDPKTALGPATISTTSALPNSVVIKIWTTKGGAQSSVTIHSSGISNAHSGR